MIGVKSAERHPLDAIIRADRMPHIWCPGCGIGIVMRCYAQAILDSGLPADQHVVVRWVRHLGPDDDVDAVVESITQLVRNACRDRLMPEDVEAHPPTLPGVVCSLESRCGSGWG